VNSQKAIYRILCMNHRLDRILKNAIGLMIIIHLMDPLADGYNSSENSDAIPLPL
jgi:hypothetical protein